MLDYKMTYSGIEIKCLDTFCLKNTNYSKLNPSKTFKGYIENHKEELKDILNYIYNHSNETNNLLELLYMIKNHIKNIPICSNPNCNKKCVFLGFSKGYSKYCSQQCNMHSEDTLKQFKEKIKKRNIKNKIHLERYINWNNINNDADNYIKENFIIIKNNKKCLDGNKINLKGRYLQKHKDIYNYIINRYKDSNNIIENIYRLYYNINEKPKCKTCNINETKFKSFSYGYNLYCSHSCKSKNLDVRKKSIQTYNKNNELNPNRIKEINARKKETFIKHLNDGTISRYYTSDTTIYFSKPEQELLNKLINLYGKDNIYIHYRDERYSRPYDGYLYECDFYIKPLDVFIECQLHQSHGQHPYNKNDINDKKIFKEWKEKSIEYNLKNNTNNKNIYDDMIYIWTKSDIIKRNIAKKHNLSYIEIFNKIPTIENLKKLINNCKNINLVSI